MNGCLVATYTSDCNIVIIYVKSASNNFCPYFMNAMLFTIFPKIQSASMVHGDEDI